MAPALTAEPLNPKEKLSSTATPATGTRQSVRKLDAPSVGSGGVVVGSSSDTAKKPTTTVATVVEATTRVTRSKDAAKRTDSPTVNNNNKRKSNNNNNNHSDIKTAEIQMGLSAAATHASSSDGTAAAAAVDTTSSSDAIAPAAIAAATAVAAAPPEHNNNCKDTTTAELLAHLTDFGEAITAEICLRKTLPELSISKEQPATPATTVPAEAVSQLSEDVSMADVSAPLTHSVTSAEATTATITPADTVPVPESLQQLVGQDTLPQILSSAELAAAAAAAAEITDNLEERLSQLDGSPNVVLPPAVEISAASLEASVPLPPTTPNKQQPTQLQPQDILTSPQHSTISRQSTSALTLTPQSTGNNSSVNFLKDGTAGTVLEDPDIEEVLKALKTFDANQVNPDICDFNFFNDFAYNEEETAGAVTASTSGGITTTTTTAATAVARLDPEEKPNCSIISKPQRPLAECHAELELEQIVLDRRLDTLLRRMRKVQTRYMCRHASDEVAGILEWSARSSNKTLNAVPVRSAKLTAQEDTVLSVLSGRPGNKFWEEQTKHPLPASQMSNVLRHIETAARKQQICHTTGGGSASLASSSSWYSSAAQPGKRPRRSQPQHTTDGMPSTSQGAAASDAAATSSRTDEIVPNFDAYVTSELTQVAGMLQTEMREVQNAIDSDATESSSGGESADEMVNYNNSQQLSLPIARRAVWRYSRDRANIALRWSWLCAQVADLDIKIRQHNDVYNDLCRSEGRVVLESTPSPKNGYKEQQQQQQQQQPQPMDTDQSTSGDHLCSRARPLILSEFRKRKLFQTTNMHTISKKAARPSNIKCGCQWPQVPCTLCTGRPDPTAPRDLPETLMPQNRVALLDPGYHPVLSFTEDVSQSVHLEAIARQPDWQYRVMRGQAKAIARSVFKAEREAIASNGGAGGRRPGEPVKRRAYVRRKERNNNNNKNNNNRSNNSKDTTTTLQQLNNNNKNRGGGGVGVNVGLVDSGNGTGTATTSTSTTPTTTTTPFGANSNKRQHHQLATALPALSDSRQQQQQQQLNNSTSVISSNGNGNGATIKKPRNSTNTLKQQQQAHNNINNNNTHNKNINNNNSRQATSGDNNNKNNSRFNGDPKSGKQQQNNRRTSETQAQRTKERRNRLVYDIDNIVIPYSMAAQNRIELLPYKEIPTPKWRIVESDNDKKQVTDNTPKSNTKQLINGCVKRQTALPDSGTKAKPPTTPASTTATTKPEKDIKPVEVGTKPPVKINGTKLSSKEKKKKLKMKDNIKPVKQPEKPTQPLINGLTNGKAEQKEKTVELAKDTKVPAKEQLQQQPAKPVPTKQPTPINGKNKIHKINNNIVNIVKKTNAVITAPAPASAKPTPSPAATSTPAVAAAPAIKDTKKVAVKPPVEPLEPPRKRPKLQLGPSEPLKPLKLPPPPSDIDVFEDISDEAYIVRHQRALLEERHRFETLLKFPYSKRSRSNRRTDSRAESSGANTPDPASPATPHLAGPTAADNESNPSSTQAHPLDDVVMTAPKRQERRRTTSSKLKDHDRRSATPDVRDPHLPLEPPPFKPLQFPLSDEVNQQLLNQMYAPPPQQPASTVAAPVSHSKRSKSKSVSSSNGADGSSSNARSRRSSKAKSTNPSKLAQPARTSRTQLMPKLNGSRNNLQHPVPHINGDNAVVKCEPEDDEEEEEDEDVEMLLDDDDDHHHLAPPDDDNLADSVADEANLYDASIDAYIAETAGWLDEEEVPDDPFMDDDPNDPEWKRSIGVRMRKRM